MKNFGGARDSLSSKSSLVALTANVYEIFFRDYAYAYAYKRLRKIGDAACLRLSRKLDKHYD